MRGRKKRGRKKGRTPGRVARSAVRSSQVPGSDPPHTAHSPKAHSYCPPPGVPQHPSLRDHLPQKQPLARARWRPGGGRPSCAPGEERLFPPGRRRNAKSLPGHEFLTPRYTHPHMSPPASAKARSRAASLAPKPKSGVPIPAPWRGYPAEGPSETEQHPSRPSLGRGSRHFSTKSKQKKANATLPRETKVCL